jgi:probable F420-dependent oxidoreductase
MGTSASQDRHPVASCLGELGVWGLFSHLGAGAFMSLARAVERWGYGTLWSPEAFGRDPLIASCCVFAATTTLRAATGIASIYARDALATLNAQHALAEQSGGRFVLGLGVSHQRMVQDVRGHAYRKPLEAMQSYLEAMAKAYYMGVPPPSKPPTVLAALGPRMLELSSRLADGAHTYNVTPDHTAHARALLGPRKLLCVEQMVVLETNPATAREIARRMLVHSLPLPNYRRAFLGMGFSERDLEGSGSDRLVDSIVAWGDEEAIRSRIQQHWDAGADHVCIQSLPRHGLALEQPDQQIFALLAPAGQTAGKNNG